MLQLPIALQVFSLRNLYEANPLATLKTIKAAGYTGVEFFGTHFKPEFYRALLAETGLVCAGWHTGLEALENDFEGVVERNLAVGNRYICVPYYNAPDADGWRDFAARLNAAAERLAPYGMRTGYHNHAHEFSAVNGELPWDIVAKNTSSRVILQLDTGNAAEGGANVLETLNQYPGRTQSIHLKPYSHSAGFVPAIGEDDLPWEGIIDYCEKQGNTEWLIVEYEIEDDPVSAVKRSIDFLHQLRG